MGKREAANDPGPERVPSDEQFKQWLAERNSRKEEELLNQCPPGCHEINIEGSKPFYGRWLLQYFDLRSERRYSIGRRMDGMFFVLCLYDSDQHTTLNWFPEEDALYLSIGIPKNKWSRIHRSANDE